MVRYLTLFFFIQITLAHTPFFLMSTGHIHDGEFMAKVRHFAPFVVVDSRVRRCCPTRTPLRHTAKIRGRVALRKKTDISTSLLSSSSLSSPGTRRSESLSSSARTLPSSRLATAPSLTLERYVARQPWFIHPTTSLTSVPPDLRHLLLLPSRPVTSLRVVPCQGCRHGRRLR